jgi:hypothetical protein
MAHRGVLFLDELPEFSASTLEMLRQPLEDRTVTLARASGTLTFPAKFTLVAATNLCPYGFVGDPGQHNRVESCRNYTAVISKTTIPIRNIPSSPMAAMRSRRWARTAFASSTRIQCDVTIVVPISPTTTT